MVPESGPDTAEIREQRHLRITRSTRPGRVIGSEAGQPTETERSNRYYGKVGPDKEGKLDFLPQGVEIVPYTEARNPETGESAVISFKINPELVRLGGEIVSWHWAETGVPFKTISDIARDAYFKYTMGVWQQFHPERADVNLFYRAVRTMQHRAKENEKRVAAEHLIGSYGTFIRQLEREDEWERILEELTVVKKNIRLMLKDDEFWGRRYIRRFLGHEVIFRCINIFDDDEFTRNHETIRQFMDWYQEYVVEEEGREAA